MRTFILRDFSYYDENNNFLYSNGYITVNIFKNCIIEFIIDELHEDIGIQSILLVKYNDNKINLYNIINKILDKISYDLHYKYIEEMPYHKDYIINDDSEINYPEIWNYDKKNNIKGLWVYFNEENIKYLSLNDISEYISIDNNEYIVIHGEVNEEGNFSYDYPIIASCAPINIYNESRGNIDYLWNNRKEY